MKMSKTTLKDLTYQINGAAIEVHKNLGPGLLESVYHECLKYELKSRDLKFSSELKIPLNYKGFELETNLRCDLFVENAVVIELKAIESILPIHEAQVLSYMKLLKAPKGILFNFNTVNLYLKGQKTFVSEFFRTMPN